MAEVVLRHLATEIPLAADGAGGSGMTLADQLEVSSAGTGPWHEGEPMDPRARAALAALGYEDHGHVAHQFDLRQFGQLDLLVALDRRHQQTLRSLSGSQPDEGRLVLLRSFDRDAGGAVDVPDPFYGNDNDFDRCLLQVQAACRGLAAALATALTGTPGHGS
jgi:protein-tyrosine phosphatase